MVLSQIFCIVAHLLHDKRELMEIDGTDAFQIWNTSSPPIFIFLFWQYASLHEYVNWRTISSLLALLVHGRMHFSDDLTIFQWGIAS